MEQGNRKLTLDQPASYQIIVPGVLDESWSDLGEGVTIAIDCETGQFPVTIITGILDQAALHGLLRQLYENWDGPEADALQARANAMRSAVLGSAPIPSIKAMVADQMDDPGWRTVRPPWVTLDDEQAAGVIASSAAAALSDPFLIASSTACNALRCVVTAISRL